MAAESAEFAVGQHVLFCVNKGGPLLAGVILSKSYMLKLRTAEDRIKTRHSNDAADDSYLLPADSSLTLVSTTRHALGEVLVYDLTPTCFDVGRELSDSVNGQVVWEWDRGSVPAVVVLATTCFKILGQWAIGNPSVEEVDAVEPRGEIYSTIPLSHIQPRDA